MCDMSEWEDGWRVSIVDKEKQFLKALSRTGRMYLTKRCCQCHLLLTEQSYCLQ